MPSDSQLTNPFASAMLQAKTAAEEFSKRFSDMKMPAMMPDAEALLAAHRRNIEAFTAANKIAMEGAQAVARRHMEILQQTMSELTETMQALAGAEPPQVKAAKQADLMKRSYEHAVANTRELSDLIQRSNSEALGLLNKRVAEALDEAKALMAKAGKVA